MKNVTRPAGPPKKRKRRLNNLPGGSLPIYEEPMGKRVELRLPDDLYERLQAARQSVSWRRRETLQQAIRRILAAALPPQ